MPGRKKLDLKREYRKTTLDLANLNRELAAKMILLASQTGDTSPLIQAVDALEKADEYFSAESTPREVAEIRQALAETLHALGKTQNDLDALSRSIDAYRSAILWRLFLVTIKCVIRSRRIMKRHVS